MRLEIDIAPALGERRGSFVLLHGAWCWNWYFKPFFRPYFAANGFDVIAFSLRGHGGSEGRELLNGFSIDDYVEDLRGVVATVERPVVVGHSMGGFVLQTYLTQASLRGAVLLASAPPRPMPGGLIKSLIAQPLNVFRAARQGAEFNRNMLRQKMFSRGPEDKSMDAYLENVQPESSRVAASMLTRNIAHPETIGTPIQVIGAGRDRLVPPEAVALTARAYRTQPVMFDAMSHMLMLEPHWRDVADAILRFEASLPA
ncbi:alpha/beta hydrolase [Acidocella sp.]|uniref:alpha/beta hydrolase n=1 Tax=Acidocella sp. TaxID=50710 RepID=UPI002F421677